MQPTAATILSVPGVPGVLALARDPILYNHPLVPIRKSARGSEFPEAPLAIVIEGEFSLGPNP